MTNDNPNCTELTKIDGIDRFIASRSAKAPGQVGILLNVSNHVYSRPVATTQVTDAGQAHISQ